VHLHHTDPERLVGLLSLDDADRLLTSTGIRTPALRLARDGTVLPESAYTRGASLAGRPLTGLVDPRKALKLFDEGATIVFQGLHRYWEPLTELTAALELELGHPCQANAYLTPPGAQGFAVHCDTHDVFVLQTHGRKRWEIHGEDGVDDVLLEPGLSMYLPTGTAHAARAEEVASLHVTIGINQLTWRGLVEHTVQSLLSEVEATHLPAGRPGTTPGLASGLRERLDALADALRGLDASDAVRRHTERFLTSRNPRLRGGLHSLLAVRDLADDSVVRRRAGATLHLSTDGDRLVALLGDRRLDMPGWVGAAMAAIEGYVEFCPADLAEHGLDEPSRLVLCRRLVREGLLEVAG
jgi:lysine-specific demethylase/histidyl-hydroxylase NO66